MQRTKSVRFLDYQPALLPAESQPPPPLSHGALASTSACSQVEVVGCIVENYTPGDNCTTS